MADCCRFQVASVMAGDSEEAVHGVAALQILAT
jgi:hypothetical protein